jgi:hypothetical protein
VLGPVVAAITGATIPVAVPGSAVRCFTAVELGLTGPPPVLDAAPGVVAVAVGSAIAVVGVVAGAPAGSALVGSVDVEGGVVVVGAVVGAVTPVAVGVPVATGDPGAVTPVAVGVALLEPSVAAPEAPAPALGVWVEVAVVGNVLVVAEAVVTGVSVTDATVETVLVVVGFAVRAATAARVLPGVVGAARATAAARWA